jgi:hypothetical protein
LEFVELRGGLTLPVDILEFALKLENRGLHLQADGEILRITSDAGKPDLSDEEMAFIRLRKAHLLAVASYQAPELVPPPRLTLP